MKYATYAEYDPKGMALAVPGLLTVWAGIQRLRDELVLVGGLVPHFICTHPASNHRFPRPGTLDVDIGIAIGASSGQYPGLQAELQGQGFRLNGDRFEKKVGLYTLYVDFLVEDPRGRRGAIPVDDVPANVMPGIDRALATARQQAVSGIDLLGAKQHFTIPICEVGPFLALKLRAFGSRQAPKDAFDVLYTLLHYDGGTDAAIAAFGTEAQAGNSAMPDAITCLKNFFQHEDSPAPVRAAHFVHGEIDTGEGEDIRTARLQIRQDVVTLGHTLLAAI
jgi:hypothetical protein